MTDPHLDATHDESEPPQSRPQSGVREPPDEPSKQTSQIDTRPAHQRKFIAAASLPTQIDEESGVRWDYNFGARILLPANGRTYAYRIDDTSNGNVIVMGETTTPESEDPESAPKRILQTRQRYFIPLRIRVWEKTDETDEPYLLVVDEPWSGRGRNIMIQLPRGAVGDTLAWFPYAARFAEQHGANVTVMMREDIAELYRDSHPHMSLEDPPADTAYPVEKFYATYYPGLYYGDDDNSWQPRDFRQTGLHRNIGYLLGVDPETPPPPLGVPDDGPPIEGPYVCIATLSTMQAKHWNNPGAWMEVVRYLKASGYRVIDIDRDRISGSGIVWNTIPNGAEDETGARPLAERVRWLRHCSFFIGLSSGLSWLAYACGTPVMMISGFTNPDNEFRTEARVWNPIPCNSCWHDSRLRFDTSNYLWCPRHENTPRQFECSRHIGVAQVISALRAMPSYRKTAVTVPTHEGYDE